MFKSSRKISNLMTNKNNFIKNRAVDRNLNPNRMKNKNQRERKQARERTNNTNQIKRF